jgi:hypothetical protein
MNQAAEMKSLKRDMAEKEPSFSNLGNFNPDNFNAYKDAFLNLLAQSYSMICEPLRYVVWPEAVPETFVTMEEQHCISSCLLATLLSWIISLSTGNLRPF